MFSIFIRAQRSLWRNVPSPPSQAHAQGFASANTLRKASVLLKLSIIKGQLNKRSIFPEEQEAQILLESSV